jgi:hypothetical protein
MATKYEHQECGQNRTQIVAEIENKGKKCLKNIWFESYATR